MTTTATVRDVPQLVAAVEHDERLLAAAHARITAQDAALVRLWGFARAWSGLTDAQIEVHVGVPCPCPDGEVAR